MGKNRDKSQKCPFNYGVMVSENSFTNREDDVKKLYDNLTHGINTMLISPRRWGKSSLVEKVKEKILKEESDVLVMSIDFYKVSSQEEFLAIFAKEVIKSSSNKWKDWVQVAKDLLNQLKVQVKVDVSAKVDINIQFDKRDLKEQQEVILNLPQVIAEKKGKKFIVCLDEFQNLAEFSEYEQLEKKMRAVWQQQKDVTYCIYGSKRQMMREIFNDSSKPFYRFGDIVHLNKIKREKWVEFISSNFELTGKHIDEKYAKLIPELMDDHSWYVQQLSHYTWQKTYEGVDAETLKSALDEVVNANTPLYQKEVEVISTTQLNMIKAVISGETQLSSTSVMQEYGLGTSANVVKNKRILIAQDVFDKFDDGYMMLDPVFTLWFKKIFFDEEYLELID